MDSNNVNAIIDNICAKLNTTASTVVPEYAKYQIATHLIKFITALVVLIVFIILLRAAIKYFSTRLKDESLRWTERDDIQIYYVMTAFACAIVIIGAFCFMIDGLKFITWIIAPYGAFTNILIG